MFDKLKELTIKHSSIINLSITGYFFLTNIALCRFDYAIGNLASGWLLFVLFTKKD